MQQVVAHRANSQALVQQALDWGCDFAEVDVWEASDGRLLVTRNPDTEGDPLDRILSLSFGLYLDVRGASAEAVARAVAGRPRTVIWGPAFWLADLHAVDPALPVMPQAESLEHLARMQSALRPRAVAFDDRDFTPPLVTAAKAFGAQIFVDRLRDHDQPWHWEAAWQLGADAIQTDRPRELLRTLGR